MPRSGRASAPRHLSSVPPAGPSPAGEHSPAGAAEDAAPAIRRCWFCQWLQARPGEADRCEQCGADLDHPEPR